MIATNFSSARKNFKKYCDAAVHDSEAVVVTRKHDENVVILSESEYNNLMENLYIRSDKKYYDELIESIEQLKRDGGTVHELVDDE